MSDNRDEEIERLRRQLEQAESARRVEVANTVKGTTTSGGGFKGGFFGCLGVVAAIFFLIFLVIGMATCGAMSNSSSPSTASGSSQTPGGVTSVPHSWTVATSTDSMNRSQRTACVVSTNEVQLNFPYRSQNASLCLRRGPSGTDVYVDFAQSAQIVCGVTGCRIPVAFGQEAPRNYTGRGPSDYSTQTLFLVPAQGFIRRAQSARRIVIEIPMYQSGNHQLVFEPATPLSQTQPAFQ